MVVQETTLGGSGRDSAEWLCKRQRKAVVHRRDSAERLREGQSKVVVGGQPKVEVGGQR